ncbi:MAG TPA: DNA-formamidopyrimidine glycosylase family protein [Thermoleophilia bacterium]|nr:DNA-formamidopyrimidine glycosylase family protein [Thermoleophilia bacterium]
MPESPEAEVCARGLSRLITGYRVAEARCTQPGRIVSPARDAAAWADGLVGRTVSGVARRGKRVVLRFDDGSALVFGFGLRAEVTVGAAEPEDLHGAVLRLSGGPDGGVRRVLAFDKLALSTLALERWAPPPEGPPLDALDRRTDGSALAALGRSRTGLKAFLMDERFVLGIGNGYSDEILWEARLHPRRPAVSLLPEEWARLAQAMRRTLQAAVAAGGEIGFLDPFGAPGRFERRIHHHGGEPCPRCGQPLAALVSGGRETDFCPVCQVL